MNRFATTLIAAAFIVTLAASAANAQGYGRTYRVEPSRGLRLQSNVRQYNQGGLQHRDPRISQSGHRHGSHQQCSDGHCHESHGQCSDGHCHDQGGFEVLNRHQCSGPNCDDCEDCGETYDEPDYEADVEPGY